jgi:hypothetical protein
MEQNAIEHSNVLISITRTKKGHTKITDFVLLLNLELLISRSKWACLDILRGTYLQKTNPEAQKTKARYIYIVVLIFCFKFQNINLNWPKKIPYVS